MWHAGNDSGESPLELVWARCGWAAVKSKNFK